MKNVIKTVSMGDLVDRLSITNLKIWNLERQTRTGLHWKTGKKLTDAEIGRLTKEIRELNDNQRVVFKNAINELFNHSKEIRAY